MSFLGNIGNWLWNGAKGAASALGFDTSSFENDEAHKFQAHQSQMNRDFQERMLQKQMDYQTDMWNKTNEYNSAKAQVQRYREAGLNPYLMMTGGASAGVATSQGTPLPSGGSSPSGGFANTHPTAAGQFIDNLSSAKANEATERNMNADAVLKEIEANTRAEQLLADLEKTRLGNENQSIINSMQFELLDATHKQILQQINTLESQEKLNRMDEVYRSIQVDYLPAQLKAEIANKVVDTEFLENLRRTEGYKQYQIMQEVLESSAREENIHLNNVQLRAAAQHVLNIIKSNAYWAGWNNFTEGLGNLGQGIGSLGNLRPKNSTTTQYHNHGGHRTIINNK